VGNAELPGQLQRINLPIQEALPDLLAALAAHSSAVLQAPPGAGKTTLVPLALLDQRWLGTQRIIMLEPRRLAARAAARRMADLLAEQVGETVGYRIRQDSKIGPKTRIEVVTEGILTRMIQDDPELSGIGAVLFDEFHERNLPGDLGLALSLEIQTGLRDDLRLLVMSATLDGERVAAMLGGAPIITSQGRAFPVEIRWLERPEPRTFDAAMASAILRALDETESGDLLAFLPGQGEIRRVERQLADFGCSALVLPLFGDLPAGEQDRALLPVPGRRKVVLSTAIAETSLTIEGVSIVVDGGQMRVPRFDPNGGMTRLVTLPVAKASAEQRRGRAGRLGPGVCYRLWSEADHRALPAYAAPEILEADLAPLALELIRWGTQDPNELPWLDAPPAAAYAQAMTLLEELDAVAAGRITAHGKAMAALPVHPRLAHMMIKGRELGLGGLACAIAALLSERDILRARDADLRRRIEVMVGGQDRDTDRGALMRVRDLARQLRRQLSVPEAKRSLHQAGLLLAFAFPDRVAQRRAGDGLSYRLANGRGAFFPQPDAISASPYIVVADLDGERKEARIFLAAPIDRADLDEHFTAHLRRQDSVVWDKREQAVLARRQTRFGALVLEESKLDTPPADLVAAAQLQAIADLGLDALPWSDAAHHLRQRIAFLRRHQPDQWPDLSDAHLLETIADWLGPYLAGMSRAAHWQKLDLAAILRDSLAWEQRQALDRLAPTHIDVPSGSHIPINYDNDEQPVLAVRLQEMFGLAETPSLLDGKVPLLLHLLSPARRPLQVTRDLAGFWSGSYKSVKADMKGQYPKHYWPDDPMQAEPTARAKPRGS
jgi:ATP-dependent helicase HrpB